jgi:uncharacterized membrane protein YhaH (DUF805 family)
MYGRRSCEMVLTCPKCGKQIENANINIAQDVAFCAPCGEMHKVSVLAGAPAAQSVPPPPPYGQPPQPAVPAAQNVLPNQYQQPQYVPPPQPVYQPYQPPYPTPPLAARPAGTEKNGWRYFVGALEKFAVFSGRARRAEFWWFALFSGIFYGFVCLLVSVATVGFQANLVDDISWFTAVYGLFQLMSAQTLLEMLLGLPFLGVFIRRIHDTGKSGWFLLVPIYNLILMFIGGTPGPNQYGPDPRERT